jgi:hypothetical protein
LHRRSLLLLVKMNVNPVLLHVRLESKLCIAHVALEPKNFVNFVLVDPQVFTLEELKTTQVALKLSPVLVTLDVPCQCALGGVGSTTQGARESRTVVTLHVPCQSTLAFIGLPAALAGVVALLLMSQHV